MRLNSLSTRVLSLLEAMTIDEKIGQLAMRGKLSFQKTGLTEDLVAQVREGQIGAFLNIKEMDDLDELQRIAVEESRLKIPLIFARDVIHGYHTVFPIPLGMACSWDPDVARVSARIASTEATLKGVRWTFAPMIDVSRDARWGRIAESFGEDPLLNEKMGCAMIEGFQTEDLSHPSAMAACAKHFVGYGASEGGRDYNSTLIPPRELRDIYLEPFAAAVKSGVATIMSAFNDLDGVPSSGNVELLYEILREEWGFQGLVVSDWESVTEMITHGYATDEKEAALKSCRAGLGMEMTSRSYEHHLQAWVESGVIAIEWLDQLVAQVLTLKEKLGLFEDATRNKVKLSENDRNDHLAAAKEAATKSIVLLKNHAQRLPLNLKNQKLAVIGPMAHQAREQLGTWVFDGDTSRSQTPLDALQSVISEDHLFYAAGLEYSRDTRTDGFADAIRAAAAADVVLFFAGEEAILSGEAHSMANIDLPGAQEALLLELATCGKPIVLVLMSGRPNCIHRILEHVDAVLVSFHGGSMVGPALLDVLTGVVSPEGRLPVTWPKTTGQIPIYYNHKRTGRPASEEKYVTLDEIPVGAWQSSLGNDSHYLDYGYSPEFPFGYGLTYGKAVYHDLWLSSKTMSGEHPISVFAKITNEGTHIIHETIQLYICDLAASVTRPVRELKGFKKVEIHPSETIEVAFTLTTEDLQFTGIDYSRDSESGWFDVWIAPDASGGVKGTFLLTDENN